MAGNNSSSCGGDHSHAPDGAQANREDSRVPGRAECVIFVGVPAAGKTTFYRERLSVTHRHISKDLWPHARDRDARQRRLLAAALAAGESVVVDNTNPSRRERGPLIDIARTHGARTIAYFFDVSTRAAVARNAQRTGRDQVPKVAIFTVARRLEPPALDEGFDEIVRLTIGPDRSLVVAKDGVEHAERESPSRPAE
jgi:predicted kinase